MAAFSTFAHQHCFENSITHTPGVVKHERVDFRAMSGAPHDWLSTMAALNAGDRVALVRVTGLITGHLARYGAYRYQDSWEDVVQTVLIKLIHSHDRGSIREPRAFVSYVGVMTRNAFNDWLKRHKRPGSPFGEGDSELNELSAPEEIDRGLRIDLQRALAELPERTRLVLETVYLDGMSYQEAASHLELPLGTLKRIQTDGLKEVRKKMNLSRMKNRSVRVGTGVT